MLKIDLEIAEKIEVFVVFDAFSVQFPRAFVISLKRSTLKERVMQYIF